MSQFGFERPSRRGSYRREDRLVGNDERTAAKVAVRSSFCGEGGIRTRDTLLRYTHFPGVLLRPLGHFSLTDPLRRTRASGDQTCRKVRKFLKTKKYRRRICAFRTNAHLSPADRYAARPLRYRTVPASRPVPSSCSGSPFRCRYFRYRILTYADAASSPRKSEYGRPARRPVPIRTKRLAAVPVRIGSGSAQTP